IRASRPPSARGRRPDRRSDDRGCPATRADERSGPSPSREANLGARDAAPSVTGTTRHIYDSTSADGGGATPVADAIESYGPKLFDARPALAQPGQSGWLERAPLHEACAVPA